MFEVESAPSQTFNCPLTADEYSSTNIQEHLPIVRIYSRADIKL